MHEILDILFCSSLHWQEDVKVGTASLPDSLLWEESAPFMLQVEPVGCVPTLTHPRTPPITSAWTVPGGNPSQHLGKTEEGDFRASWEWEGWERSWGDPSGRGHSPCSRAGRSRCPRWLGCWWCGCPSPQQGDRSTSCSPSFLSPLEPHWDLLAENPPHETRCLRLRRKGTILSRHFNPSLLLPEPPKSWNVSCSCPLLPMSPWTGLPPPLPSSLLSFPQPSSALPGSPPPPEQDSTVTFYPAWVSQDVFTLWAQGMIVFLGKRRKKGGQEGKNCCGV